MTRRLPPQWRHWCQSAGLRPWGPGRDAWRWFYLRGHGRVWRVNDQWQFQCGDTIQDFDRWALCDIQQVPLPATRAAFRQTVRDLLQAHAQKNVLTD